jgi:hypothetical protein
MSKDSEITIDLSTAQDVGNNVDAILQDGLLILIIGVEKPIGPSSSGKMIGYGSTEGFANMPGGFKGNVYVGKKA